MMGKKQILYLSGILFLAGVMALSFILLFSEEASAAGRPYITIQGSSSKETPPGTQVSYEIEVENRGTTDNFNISLHYSNPDGEWTVYASATSLHINENSQKSFYVYVKPHKNDTMPDADDILQVTVKVKAVSGPDSDSAIVTTTCLQKYDIALETVDPTEKDAYPGDTVTFYYNITNPGNGQDTYYGQFTKIPSTWEERSSFDDGITLNRDEKATMKKVTVYVDKEAEQGVFQINVEFHSDGDNTKKRTVSYSVNVLAKPDFSVTAKGDNVKSTKPNIGVKFSLNITNTGNIEDSYTLWVDQSSVPSGWSVTLHSSSTDTIDPDETISKDNIITVKPPADLSQAPYGDSLGVEVHVTSTYNSSLNKTVTFTTEIEQVYKLDLEANVTTLYAKQGEERKVTITVKNTGNGQDKVSLSLSGTKKKWGLLGKQFVTVERIADPLGRDQQNVTLTITIPSDAQAIEEGYTIVVDATSSDPEGIVKASQPIKIYVEQVYGVTVEVNGSTTQEVVPDHSITYTIVVTNTGNGEDSFVTDIMALNEINNETAEGWASIPNTGKMAGNDTKKELTLTIDVPDEQPKGDYELRIYVNSTGDSTVFDYVDIKIKVKQIYDFKRTSEASKKRGKPGDVVYFEMKVKNTGTGKDSFTIDTVEVPDVLTVTIKPSLTDDLDIDESVDINISVEIKEESPNKDFTFNLSIASNGDTSLVKYKEFTVSVDKYYDFEFSVKSGTPSSISVDPGDPTNRTAEFIFTLHNKGTGDDKILFDVDESQIPVDESWSVLLADEVLTAGEWKNVTLTITVDENAKQQKNGIPFNITATSENDPTVVKVLTVKVVVEQSYDLEVSTTANKKFADPDSNITYRLEVWNKGTGRDTFKIEKEGTIPSDLTVTIEPTSVTLNADQRTNVTITVYIKDETPNVDLYFNISATSDGKSSLKKVQEFIVSVNKYYDFDISIEGDANVEVEPGQVAIFNISVENKGTGDHRIYFDVNETNIPAGESWSVLKSDPFLKVGETKTVQIKITVDEDGVEQKDGIPFKVTATSEKDSRIVRELTIKVIVKQKFDLDISTTAQKKFVDPGTNVSYHIEVWNKGTGEDTFYIETLGTIPEEFTVTIEPTSVTLGADQKTNVTITIDVEKDAANQEKTLTIRAYSDGDPNVEDTQDIIVSVNEYYEFKFTLASDDTKKADPGDEVVFYFTIENTGTGDDTIRFEVDTSNVPFVPGSEPPRKEQWGVVMSEVAVKAGEKKSVSLTITVDDKAQEQKDGILFNITAISTEDTHTPPFTKTSRVTVQVNQTYAVSFTQTTYEKTVDPGTDARFEVTLKNTGTGTDTFEVNIYDEEGTGWELSNDYVAREIGPQETITFNVTIKVKADAQPVPKEFRVMAKSKEAKENKDLWVSENATLKLTVNPSYGVEFSSSSQLQYAYPSYGNPATLTFSLMITNTGTTTDDFRCEINATYTKASVYDWAEITQGSVINGLGAGKTQTIQIRITVRPYDEDHDATPGPKNFWILVYSKTARDNGKEVLNTTTDLFRATVDVRPYYYVTVEPLTTNTPKLQVGENATFEISVKNLGNTPDTITMIKDGDAPTNGKYSRWQSFDKSSVYLQPDTSTTVNMTITVLPEKDAETGTYNFYFHAKSVGDPDVESQQKYNSIEIEETFGVNIEVTSEELTISPGEYAAFPIQVTNKGNSRTEITLVKPDVAYEDWEVYWSNSPESSTEIDTTGNLDPAQTTTVYLKIQPSSNTSKAIARSYTIPFKVKSGTGTDTVYDYGNVTINIERKYDIAVSASIDSDSIKPGEKTTYYVKVENRGNAWDNFTYEIIDQSKFNWVYLDETNVTKSTEEHPNGYNITTKEISLGPWQFLRVPFVVEIPPYSDENDDAEARINYRVDVKFISTGDSSVNDKQRLTTTVEQIYDVSIEAKNGKDTKEVKLKETGISYVDFILEVKNLGNGDDIFLIKVPSGELEGEKENWQIEFRRDGSVIPAQGFSLPTLTKEEITVTIGVDDRTAPDDYTLDIDVSSKGDTDVRKTVTLNLHCIKAEYGVKIEAVSEKNRWNQTANPADLPQNGIEYRFKVRNTGSQEDSFKLKVETNTGSGTYRGWEIMFDTELGLQDEMIVPTDVPGWTGGDTLEEDEEVEIRVYVKPPEDEDASGKDEDKYSDLEISAESQQDTSKTDTIFFRLIIIRPDLRIGPDDIRIDTTDKIQEGDTVDLEITIHNDGMAESGKFDVWVYKSKEDSLSGVGGTVGVGGLIAHEKDVESIDPESSYTLTIDWDIEWGKHEIYVYVDKPISTGADKTDDPDKGDVIEISERNNDAKMLSEYQQYVDLRPWIEISGIDWNKDPQKDETVTITVTIFNNDNKMAVASYGDSPNDPSDMYVRCKAGGEYLKPKKGTFTPETGYKVTEKIPAGEELEIEFEWKVTDDAGTEVKIKAYIDYSENKNDNDTDTIKLKIKEKSTGIAGFGETSTTTVMGMGGIIIILILIVLLLVVKGKKTKIPAGLEGVPPKKKEKKAKKEEKKKPPLKPGAKPPVKPPKPGVKPPAKPPMKPAKPGTTTVTPTKPGVKPPAKPPVKPPAKPGTTMTPPKPGVKPPAKPPVKK